jgi:broad-specificity NMP kinase
MKAEIYFITGVPGSGKSTVMELLKLEMDPHYQIHDFDERGVPDNVGQSNWQEEETLHWIKKGIENQEKGITTIICGFAVPPHVKDIYPAKFILLDLDQHALEDRLSERYKSEANIVELKRMTGKTPEESIAENVKSIQWLHGLCADYGAIIINTSDLPPQQVVTKVKELITNNKSHE